MAFLRTLSSLLQENLTLVLYVWGAMNLLAFLLYSLDKFKARRHLWRIPEFTLLAVATLGGAAGALASIYLFRHKTKHVKFTICVPVILILQLLLWIVLWLV